MSLLTGQTCVLSSDILFPSLPTMHPFWLQLLWERGNLSKALTNVSLQSPVALVSYSNSLLVIHHFTTICLQRWPRYSAFHRLYDPASCLHYFISKRKTDNCQITKLRKPAAYEVPFARTNKFINPFILYALTMSMLTPPDTPVIRRNIFILVYL